MRYLQPRQVRLSPEFNNRTHGPNDVGVSFALHRCLNIEHRKGILRPGADADLVVLDRRGRVVSTWVLGREVYKRS